VSVSSFSIENNLLANQVNLELSEQQESLGTSVRDLSSGLRINTAADDPSGNAIATTLTTHAQAFAQASQNITNAQNAAAVADGALGSVTDILLRIRELAIGAASSVDSTADRVSVQSEINQLLLEINRIAQNTNFNGRSLLDGSVAGYQAAQDAQAIVTANSVLLSSNPNNAQSSSSYLVADASLYTDILQPPVEFGIAQAVTPSTVAQTVHVDSTQDLEPGDVFSLDGGIITVQSVDAANSTVTAVFSTAVNEGDVASPVVNTSLAVGVSAGTQIATLANPSPLYAGEILQVAYGSLSTNDVVVVQQVLSSTSFVATFTLPHPAGASVYSTNDVGIGGSLGAGNYTFSFGTGEATDGAPIGSTAYVVEQTGSGTSEVTQVVGEGKVVAGSVTSSTIDFPDAIDAAPGGSLTVIEQVGLGATPLVTTVDGTITLTVVQQSSGAVGVQESFYDTATQTEVTSPYLLQPGERTMLYDGVVTTIGDFTAADLGSTAYIKVLQSTSALMGTLTPALTVQSGADEGDVIQIGIPAVNTQALRISTVTVIGASVADPTIAAQDAVGQLDYALTQVNTIRSQVGAQIVKLGIDQTNDNTESTNLTASESNIADLDMGSAATAYTEQQVDINVATSVLEQVNALEEQVLKLFET
jgi:flagellin